MKLVVENFCWNQHKKLIGSIGELKRWILDCPIVEIAGKEYLIDSWELYKPRYLFGNKRKILSKSLRYRIFRKNNFCCQYCGRKAPDVILHIDHIKPIAKGGTNDENNLITSCADCNLGKGSLFDE